MKTKNIYIAEIAKIVKIEPAFNSELGFLNFENLNYKFLVKKCKNGTFELLFSKLKLSNQYTAKDVGSFFISGYEPIRLYTTKVKESKKRLFKMENLINEDPKTFEMIFKRKDKEETKKTSKRKK